MDELVTKRVQFLVDSNDKNTGEKYPVGVEVALERTQTDFDLLVAAGVVQLLED